MRTETFILENPASALSVASEFLKATEGRRQFAFKGSMGAGKTTFIKAICEVLGVRQQVTSPTFALVNEYLTADGTTVCHFDFYRLTSPSQVYDIGGEEYFDSDSWCFVEWPEKADSVLPEDITVVTIEEIEETKRKITVYL